MELGGWHRLWIVACVMWLAVLTLGNAQETLPGIEDIPHQESFYEQMSSEARLALAAQRERQRDLTEGVPMRLPNGHVWGFRPRDDEDSDSFRRRYMVVHGYTEVLEANLPRHRAVFVAQRFAVWWLVPCLLIYMLGWSMGWIYREFRTSRSDS